MGNVKCIQKQVSAFRKMGKEKTIKSTLGLLAYFTKINIIFAHCIKILIN